MDAETTLVTETTTKTIEREKPAKDGDLAANSKANLDKKLDNAIDESFPSSDPVSVKITK